MEVFLRFDNVKLIEAKLPKISTAEITKNRALKWQKLLMVEVYVKFVSMERGFMGFAERNEEAP